MEAELVEMSRDLREKRELLMDILQELEITINRLRVIGKGLEKATQTENINNECIGDMQ